MSDQIVSIMEEKKMRALAKVDLFLLNPSARRKCQEVVSVYVCLSVHRGAGE